MPAVTVYPTLQGFQKQTGIEVDYVAGVFRGDAVDDLVRRPALGQQVHATRPVQRIHQGLGGERADSAHQATGLEAPYA